MCEVAEAAQAVPPLPIKRLQRDDQRVLSQLLQLEKRLFKKSDNWGDLLIKETQRRNTFLLYAEAPVSPAPAAAPSSPPQQHSLAPQRKAVQQGRKQAASPHPQQAAQQPRAPAVVAYLVYTTTGLSAHISKLAVAPDWRRRGVARALVREAVRAAQQERRASSVSLHVDAGNAPALALYRGEGFESEALLEDYYSRGRHAHKMRLELDSGY